MRPFLRWAGGKRWLIKTGRINLSSKLRHVEPFLGGGAVFFAHAEATTALLSDLNKYLINSFVWMKSSPEELYELTQTHFSRHSAEHYYEVRAAMGSSSLLDAAAFIYLNRCCFNGLFRVNLAGRFNVPIGTKAFVLDDKDEFHRWSKHLENAEIILGDFEEIIDQCGPGDMLFVDPPYTVAHNTNGFIEYNERIFSWNDQVRLAAALNRARARGATFLLTNADHESVRALYPQEFMISETRGSEMASRSSFRGSTTELLIASSQSLFSGAR